MNVSMKFSVSSRVIDIELQKLYKHLNITSLLYFHVIYFKNEWFEGKIS